MSTKENDKEKQKNVRRTSMKNDDKLGTNDVIIYDAQDKVSCLEARQQATVDQLAKDVESIDVKKKSAEDEVYRSPDDAIDMADALNVPIPEPLTIDDKVYTFLKPIGRGGFGTVFEGVDSEGNKVAIKLTDEFSGFEVYTECQIMKLAESIDSPHFSRLLNAGRVQHGTNEKEYFCITSLLGPDLTFKDNKSVQQTSKLSATTKLILAKQCLIALEDLHNMGFAHMDIKADNYCLGKAGTKNSNVVHLIDFGRSEAINKARVQQSQEEEITSAQFDIVNWLLMVTQWFGIEIEHDFLKKDRNNDKTKKNLDLLKALPEGFQFIYLNIKTIGPIDYSFLYKILDMTIKMVAGFECIYFDLSPVDAETYSNEVYNEVKKSNMENLNNKFRAPYYDKSHGGIHLVVYYLGERYGYRNTTEEKTSFKCNATKCNRRIEVLGYNKDKTKIGDMAEVYRVINNHSCKKPGPSSAAAPTNHILKREIDFSNFFE